MKITAIRLGVPATKYPDSWIGKRLASIAARRRIDEARISLIRHRDLSPAFEVSVHLVTPGPDLFAKGCDHTMDAAFDKAFGQLGSTLSERVAKRVRRHRQRDHAKRDKSLSPS